MTPVQGRRRPGRCRSGPPATLPERLRHPRRPPATRGPGRPRRLQPRRPKSHMNQLRAEIEDHGIEPLESIASMKWTDVIDLLRINEYKRLAELELAWDIKNWSLDKKIR